MNEAPPTALTVQECCERLGLRNPHSILNWISTGELRAINISAKTGIGHRPTWRIPADALIEFIEKRSQKLPMKAVRQKKRKQREGFVRYFS